VRGINFSIFLILDPNHSEFFLMLSHIMFAIEFLLGFCLVSLPLFVLAFLVYGLLYQYIAEFVFRFFLVKLSLWKYLDVYGELFLLHFCSYGIAPAIAITLLEEAVRLISGFRSEVPPIWIWIHICWGILQVNRFLSLVNTFADAVEKTKDDMAATRTSGEGAGMAGSKTERVSRDDVGGVAQKEAAGRAESCDAREAAAAMELRIDSRGPMSVSDDNSVVVCDVSDVRVVYVGRYLDIHCDRWGWVAGVFYTSVLGYDKRVVKKSSI